MAKGTGKLKRPSLQRDELAQQPTRDLGSRRDVYEFGSPEPETAHADLSFQPLKTVNRKPLKKVRKRKAGPPQLEGRSSKSPRLEINESPSQTAKAPATGGTRKSRLRPEQHSNPQVVVIPIRKTSDASSKRGTSAKAKSPSPADRDLVDEEPEPRRATHNRPKAPRTTTARSTAPTSWPSASENLRIRIKPALSTATRPKKKKSGSAPVHKDLEQAKDSETAAGRRHQPQRGSTVKIPEPPEAEPPSNAASPSNSDAAFDADPPFDAREQSEASQDELVESAQEGHLEDTGQRDYLGQVFDFLATETQSGECDTVDATHIRQACREARERISEPEIKHNNILEDSRAIRALLTTYGRGKDDNHRKELKADAYKYLFKELIFYLEVLHSWLEDTYGNTTLSFEAMEIFAPMVRGIVSLKDEIASWKVHVIHPVYEDQSLRMVDNQIIAPLRKVDEEYRGILRRLEAAAQAKRTHKELTQRRKEKFEAEQQKERDVAVREKRWQRWQDLHIWRLQCEPDFKLRRRLVIDRQLFNVIVEASEDRDANGMKFERVPLFKERNSPPVRRMSPAMEGEWTDTQLGALIDGLKKFAGEFEQPLTFCNHVFIRKRSPCVPTDFYRVLSAGWPLA